MLNNKFLSIQLKLSNILDNIPVRILLGLILIPPTFFLFFMIAVPSIAMLGISRNDFFTNHFLNLLIIIIGVPTQTGLISIFGAWIRIVFPTYKLSTKLRITAIGFLVLGFYPIVINLVKLGMGTRDVAYLISGEFLFYCLVAFISAVFIIGTPNFYIEELS